MSGSITLVLLYAESFALLVLESLPPGHALVSKAVPCENAWCFANPRAPPSRGALPASGHSLVTSPRVPTSCCMSRGSA